jgi:heme/copper-type cytochrome/quinol oxidase subunit 2
LTKFHCELNPIELFWSYNKQCKHLVLWLVVLLWINLFIFLLAYRKQSHQYKTFKNHKEPFERVWQSCPTITIRHYFCCIDWQISAYQQGYNGPQSATVMKKYNSHQCIPGKAAMSIDVLKS